MTSISRFAPGLMLLAVVLIISGSAGEVASQSACVSPPPDLIGWWPGDGNADDFANGNNGVVGGEASFTDGMVDQAFSFEKFSGFVNIPDEGVGVPLDGFSFLTIDAWVNPDSIGWPNPESEGYVSAIVSKHDTTKPNGVSYSLLQFDGKLRLVIVQGLNPDNAVGVISTDNIPIGTWSHVAGVWRGGTDLELYLNGARMEATFFSEGSTPQATADNDVPVNIGRIESFSGTFVGPAAFFDGNIDEVGIYNRALSPGEIQAIYEAGSNGKCKGYFAADLNLEKAELVFADSPNGKDGFEVEGEFILDPTSDGIVLHDEQVELIVGVASIVIPAGSLSDDEGKFAFHDDVEGANVDLEIEMLETGRLSIKSEVAGVDLSGSSNPIDISVIIGNDFGTESLRLGGKLKYGSI